MSQYQAQASEIIEASPERVFAVIADYHKGHPAILQARYFTDMTVTQGGQGEGTVATVYMNVFGARAVYQMQVTEPQPGRVLVEEDKSAGVITTFTVEPIGGGGQARVTISTEAKTSPGLKGIVEKLLNPAIMRKIYHEELQQLAEIVQSKDGS